MQKKQLYNAIQTAVDTILPPRCVVTGEIVERPGMISGTAWGDLRFIVDPYCDVCGVPFAFDADGVETRTGETSHLDCVDCVKSLPPFNAHRSAVLYNDTSRNLVLSFKHGDQLHLSLTFVEMLSKAGADVLEHADVVMPVPLHHWRIVRRRYNQAALIASPLAKKYGIQYMADGLKRVRETPTQGHLKKAEREKNVRRAFAVSDHCRERLQGKSVVLVDDVYTTGATLKECSKTLLKAGAKRVNCLTVARVVHHLG